MVVLSWARTRARVRRRISWLAVASLASSLLAPRSARALFLDKGRNTSFRAFGHTQAPHPELEAKLLPFLNIGWLDDLSVRFAGWGFYDGIYDYGAGQYAERAADIKFRHTIQVGNQAPTSSASRARPITTTPCSRIATSATTPATCTGFATG